MITLLWVAAVVGALLVALIAAYLLLLGVLWAAGG